MCLVTESVDSGPRMCAEDAETQRGSWNKFPSVSCELEASFQSHGGVFPRWSGQLHVEYFFAYA